MALTFTRYTAAGQTVTTADVEKVIYTVPSGKVSKIIFKPAHHINSAYKTRGGNYTSSYYGGTAVYSGTTIYGMEMRVGGELILSTGSSHSVSSAGNATVLLHINKDGIHAVPNNTSASNTLAPDLRTHENGLLLIAGDTIGFKSDQTNTNTTFCYDFIVLEEDL